MPAHSARVLTPLLRQNLGPATLLGLAVAVSTVAGLLLPAALAHAVDGALAGRPGAAAPFLALLALGAAADTVAQYADPWCAARATHRLSRRLIGRVLAVGLPATSRYPVGDLVSRLTTGAPEAGLAPSGAVHAVAELLSATGALIALALIDLRLALVLLLGAPIGAALVRHFVRRVTGSAGEYQTAQAALTARLLDALAGLRTIQAAELQATETERVLAPLTDLDRAGRAIWQSQRQVQWRAALLAPALQIAVLTTAGFGVAAGRTTPGQLLAALAYSSLALGLLGITQQLFGLARARAGATRTAEVLALTPPPPRTRTLPPGPGELCFEAVTVHREGTAVLDGLRLTVPAGLSVALVGLPGSGRAALAALAGGLAEPDGGRVLLDGVPLAELSRSELGRAVSYAFARPVLLGHSLAEALAYTDPPWPGPAAVRSAARQAQADGFIRRLPEGYATPVARAPLSGGEEQRLGLARALAHGGRLLILDDATSSLDTATEAEITEALTATPHGPTRLLIARRPATAATADLVAWLHHGRLHALAPHQTLWPDPTYRALFTDHPTPAEPR
ncbi:hypothetical protein CFP65_5944 [Kitasatospora sp. MMS16-BH015]|uniref:ABC transporter transmembrane domain-containing protein n=1 Tax=Kitasatospora sp. MMS16-BH015 TaxID=2018025 RepID=UPI000CA3F062|nr:ABC transporter ATP-binding protein [Kitasatospora sp. MMS16-BH015]AUG80620.1 hypothetical protein CFP65_5944 [Kitasatospora sp. MMS16-BH015]